MWCFRSDWGQRGGFESGFLSPVLIFHSLGIIASFATRARPASVQTASSSTTAFTTSLSGDSPFVHESFYVSWSQGCGGALHKPCVIVTGCLRLTFSTNAWRGRGIGSDTGARGRVGQRRWDDAGPVDQHSRCGQGSLLSRVRLWSTCSGLARTGSSMR